MGLQGVGHDWATELNWTESEHKNIKAYHGSITDSQNMADFVDSIWIFAYSNI